MILNVFCKLYVPTDANECQDAFMCGNGTCTNTEGSFQCSCRQGFAPGPHETCEGTSAFPYHCFNFKTVKCSEDTNTVAQSCF